MAGNFPAYKTAKVDDLIPYARNSRTHSPEQVDKIAASIREFGFLNPVIVDGQNGIVAGHGRIMAAKKLGMDEVPTVEASHLTEAQKRAYIIADNRLALDAGWDDEVLRLELHALDEASFDLSLTGFDAEELSKAMFDDPVSDKADDKDLELGDLRYQVVVSCNDEDHQGHVMSQLEAEGYVCRPLIL
jgi:ParB-like chromosome segregation protein Spo0J